MDCNFAVVGCESAAADGWAPFLFARYGVDANWTQAAAYPECQLPNFFGIWPTIFVILGPQFLWRGETYVLTSQGGPLRGSLKLPIFCRAV